MFGKTIKAAAIFALLSLMPVLYTTLFVYGTFTNGTWSLGISAFLLCIGIVGSLMVITNKKVKEGAVRRKFEALAGASHFMSFRWIRVLNYTVPFMYFIFMAVGFYTRHYVLTGMSLLIFATESAVSKETIVRLGAAMYVNDLVNLFKSCKETTGKDTDKEYVKSYWDTKTDDKE